jgi:hypothetical protein
MIEREDLVALTNGTTSGIFNACRIPLVLPRLLPLILREFNYVSGVSSAQDRSSLVKINSLTPFSLLSLQNSPVNYTYNTSPVLSILTASSCISLIGGFYSVELIGGGKNNSSGLGKSFSSGFSSVTKGITNQMNVSGGGVGGDGSGDGVVFSIRLLSPFLDQMVIPRMVVRRWREIEDEAVDLSNGILSKNSDVNNNLLELRIRVLNRGSRMSSEELSKLKDKVSTIKKQLKSSKGKRKE